jgi:hypothetical protein
VREEDSGVVKVALAVVAPRALAAMESSRNELLRAMIKYRCCQGGRRPRQHRPLKDARRSRESFMAGPKRPANTRGYNVRSCFPTGVANRDRRARRRQGDVAGLVTRTESQAATKQV